MADMERPSEMDWLCYALGYLLAYMPGTTLGCRKRCCARVCCYASATRSPVLTYSMCYAVSSTDLRYAGPVSPVLTYGMG
eukprot:1833023-Rhodomonas_salina.1